MSSGLIALLDDVSALAKVAAASLDDAAGQAARAGAKAVGVVIDDTAVAPTYVQGFDAKRELPIVGKIALGSVRNKLLYLLPAALLLSAFAPWAITPLLMAGGCYLCFEGAEKIWSLVAGHVEQDSAEPGGGSLEDRKVRSAIQTDLILSAEIMAVTLGTVASQPIWLQAAILAMVGLGITGLVYGVVAIIVKADDVGLALARQERPVSRLVGSADENGLDRAVRPLSRRVGRALVVGMPWLLTILSGVGTAAMVWVGGGILIHGLEAFGVDRLGHGLEAWAERAAGWSGRWAGGVIGELVGWAVFAAGSGVVGLAVGGALLALVRGGARLVRAR